MSPVGGVLSKSAKDRIYALIKRDALDGVGDPTKRTAVFVCGQPGAGRAYAAEQVRGNLIKHAGASISISVSALREYHPHWREHGMADPMAAATTRDDVDDWSNRLTRDAMAQGKSLVLETALPQARPMLDDVARMRTAGYEVAAVVLATDRDQSRQAAMAAYDLTRSAGLAPTFVEAASHDSAYDMLRASLARIEADVAVDRLQLIVTDGRQLYANEADGGKWVRPPRALEVLDDFRERKRTPRELADSALRWQTVVQRLSTEAAVPREVASQAVTWCNEATQLAEQNAEARQMLAWGREAEAFRTMNRRQFLSEFPHHAKAIERLDEALRYAERNLDQNLDRDRFIAQSREHLATRIAEGRFAALEKVAERGGRSR